MRDALDADQLDPWLPLPERVAWFVRRVTQIYQRHAHVGTRLPAGALTLAWGDRLQPPDLEPRVAIVEKKAERRIGIVPARRRRSTPQR
jgi:hypothetical protein